MNSEGNKFEGMMIYLTWHLSKLIQRLQIRNLEHLRDFHMVQHNSPNYVRTIISNHRDEWYTAFVHT